MRQLHIIPGYLLGALLLVVIPARAQVHLNPLFTDHMVLQRETEVPVWGKAAPGAPVRVRPSWSAKTVQATAARCTPRRHARWGSRTASPGQGIRSAVRR